uniref:Glutaredoxin and cysteine rich domain containing 2 n=1 Tax=Electrophorus electricus TaxID=8005 RepID=A0A4W4EKW8_ELEEL
GEKEGKKITWKSAKPRKVRFKLASSYSGRVLKHVYEDGQELESPGETYPHSFIHAELPRHLHAEQLCGFEEVQELLAKRINIYRGTGGYAPLCYDDLQDGDDKEPVLDFGKIIIYTNNLKIIRGPQKKLIQIPDVPFVIESTNGTALTGLKGFLSLLWRLSVLVGLPVYSPQEVGGCEQCGGSGSAPCSVCHGSKLSMLANRFNESIRELRCPACDAHGLERCQSCGK